MLFIVRVLDPETHENYEYEYGNLEHAKEHYDWEVSKGVDSAVWQYDKGTETCLLTNSYSNL